MREQNLNLLKKAFVGLLMVFLSSCGGDDSPTERAVFSAKIDGGLWSATAYAASVQNVNGTVTFTIRGSGGDGEAVSLEINGTAPGEYEINNVSASRAFYQLPGNAADDILYQTENKQGADGKVLIQSYDAERRLVSGTYYFTAFNVANIPKVVTEGRFHLIPVESN